MLNSGLAIYQSSTLETKPFVYMLLLANGLERFMKVLLVLQNLEAKKTGLTNKELKALGHDLIKCRDQVLAKCYSDNFKRRGDSKADFDFLTNDTGVMELFEILNNFANSDRYLFLDATAKPDELRREWPARRWDALEQKGVDIKEFTDPKKQTVLRKLVITNVVTLLERIIRAFSRLLFSDALIDPLAKSLTTWVKNFVMLDDADLGKTSYKIQ